MANCNRCHADLSRGEVTIYAFEGDELKVKEVICHKCSDNEKLVLFQKNGTLTGNLIITALLQFMDEVRGRGQVPSHVLAIPAKERSKLLRANKEIHKAIKEFESQVWFKGLQDYVQKAEWKGHSVSVYGLKAMLYAIAGRVMITLQDEKKGVSVTLITAEDESRPCMGLQSVDGRLFDAVGLIGQAKRHFLHGRLKFAPDNQVSIL